MLKLDLIELKRIAITAVAALMLTSIAVGAAVGPARAIETNPAYARLA